MTGQSLIDFITTHANAQIRDLLSNYHSRNVNAVVIDNAQKQLEGFRDQLLQHAKVGELDNINLTPDMVRQYTLGEPIGQQTVNEAITNQKQLQSQREQLKAGTDQFETQVFGQPGASLSQALSPTMQVRDPKTNALLNVQNQGMLSQLNTFLGQQEGKTFNEQLKPLINMSLGSQGLYDSGANIELQSKALAQLEQTRQQNMMQAALGSQATLQGMQRSNLLGDIGGQQSALTNQFDLQRAGITMQFQRELEAQRELLARQLSQNRGAGGADIGSMIGMGAGALIGSFAGTGGTMMGAQLGGALGGAIGNQVSPGSGGGNSNGLLSSFFAAAPMMPSSGKSQPSQPSQPYIPMRGSNYSGSLNLGI